MIAVSTAWRTAVGMGVTVIILVTGKDPYHPDRSADLDSGSNSVFNQFETNNNYGDGTMVAGMFSGITDNALGIASLTWQARILLVLVTSRSDGWTYHSHIANGISCVVEHGAAVANMSYDVAGSLIVQNTAQ